MNDEPPKKRSSGLFLKIVVAIAAGVALGVDRLVMVLVGAPTIAAVRVSNA